jgi:hypothetical protein
MGSALPVVPRGRIQTYTHNQQARCAAVSGRYRETADMNATATILTRQSDHPQYMRALERANQVRLARAELKRKIAANEIDVADVIMDCPWEAESMAVGDLLMSQRRWGQTRCRKFLVQIPITEMKTIGSMTRRQRVALAELLCAATRASELGDAVAVGEASSSHAPVCAVAT